MPPLKTDPNIPDADGFYAELIALHNGLSDAESAALNARLIFILANQIGDRDVLSAAMKAAAAARKRGKTNAEGQ
ncbi:MAG: DUF2783 domain-containing protein [Pseudomonadota bacterium]